MTKEAFCGGRAIRAGQEKIVDGGEGLEFAGAESMETMMALRICTASAPSCINFGTPSADEGKTASMGRSDSLCGLWIDHENTKPTIRS